MSCGTTEAPQYPAVIWIIGPENYLLNERRSEWTDGQMEEVAGIRKQCMLVQVHELAGALCLSMEEQCTCLRFRLFFPQSVDFRKLIPDFVSTEAR